MRNPHFREYVRAASLSPVSDICRVCAADACYECARAFFVAIEAIVSNAEREGKVDVNGIAYQRYLVGTLELYACSYLIGTRDVAIDCGATFTLDHVLYLDQLAGAYIKYAQFTRSTNPATAATLAQKAIGIYERLYGGASPRILVSSYVYTHTHTHTNARPHNSSAPAYAAEFLSSDR